MLRAVAASLIALGTLAAAAAPAHAATAWKASFLSPPAFADATIVTGGRTVRATATPSLGGTVARIVVTNRYGDAPLRIGRAAIARRLVAGSAATGAATPVRFDGRRAVTIPAGGIVTSDPVRRRVRPFRDVAVDLYVEPGGPAPTVHPKAWQTSYLVPGDRVGDPSGDVWQPIGDRPLLERIDVRAPRSTQVLVTLGESRTNSTGATIDGYDRYPDQLARRYAAFRAKRMASGGTPGPRTAVVNAGLGGNRMLFRASTEAGPGGLGRTRRDVVDVPGVTGAVVLYGGNDLALKPRNTQGEVRRGLTRIVRKLERAGVTATLATVPPSGGFGFYDRPDYEDQRRRLNAWIRTRSPADVVADFDRAVRDAARPSRLRPAFDSGDHIHPSPRGYGRMALAVPSIAARPRTSSAAGAR